MAEDFTDTEVVELALEIAKKGGEQGRAIFYKICFTLMRQRPDMVDEFYKLNVVNMPEEDQRIVHYCISEYMRGERLDLRKLCEDHIQNAILNSSLMK